MISNCARVVAGNVDRDRFDNGTVTGANNNHVEEGRSRWVRLTVV
jgi:hypothetical protein